MASRVILIHRRDQLRAEKVLQDRLFRNPKIEIIWDSVVDEILGREQPRAVTGVRLRNVRTGAMQRDRGRGGVHRDRPRSGDRSWSRASWRWTGTAT